MECEIKLAIDAAGATRLRKSPVLREHAVSRPEEREHVDRYFDTPGFTLWKHGYALRVRTEGERHVQTLKGGGSVLAGLHRRVELEAEIRTESPDPALFARQLHEALPQLARKLGDGHDVQLEPVFVNRTKRTRWMIALPEGGGQVECALDVGELQHGERVVAVRELELEMREGDPARLYELARRVHQAVPVRIENVSKAERGYALASEAGPQAVKATPLTLERKASIGEALAAILRNCLQQMQANERGVLAGEVESLHQMRVGLRRLRAALDMVSSMVQLPEPMAADIEWLAGELGDARNWDVFVDNLLPALPLPEGHLPAMARVQAAAREEAERHRSRVRGAVGGPRYTALMLALGGWIAGRGWQRPDTPSGPLEQKVGKAAPQLVRHAAARVRKRARRFDLYRPECLHKVRIAAKKERYAREFFAALSEGKAPKRRHDLLTGMQDELGELNDSFTARGLIAQLRERVPQELALLGFIEGVLAERAAQALPRARRHVKRKLRDEAAF
jgi:inorganic triphosphatase YgiF